MVPKRLKDQGLSKKNFFLGGSKRGKKSQNFKILGKKNTYFQILGQLDPLKTLQKIFFWKFLKILGLLSILVKSF